MSDADDQQMEMEALSCIFMDDFRLLTEKPPCYDVTVLPCPGDSEENFIGAILHVTYPSNYPSVAAPQVVVRAGKSLTTAQRGQLQELVDTLIAEQMGAAMIFSVSEAVKDWLISRNVKQLSMHEEMTERQKISEQLTERKDEQENYLANLSKKLKEERILHGTMVTQANFKEWQLNFLKEQAEKNEEALKMQEERVTGKKIFLEFEKTAKLAAQAATDMDEKSNPALFYLDESLYDISGGDIDEDD